MGKNQKFCILLTATIDPCGCIITERNDPKVREQDYLIALEKWLTKTDYPIIFCENSMADLSKIRELKNNYPGRVDIIQFYGNSRAKDLGKGIGELKIIGKALEVSSFAKKAENIIKVTGRAFITNIDEILKEFEDDTFVNYCVDKNINNYKSFQTIIFIFKKEFFNYLNNRIDELNDSTGGFFEVVFGRAINDALNDGLKCVIIKHAEYDGYSGGGNIPYREFIDSLLPTN